MDSLITKLSLSFENQEKYILRQQERIDLLESDLNKRNTTLIHVNFKNMLLKQKETVYNELIE